jgi:WD40 repeat protein
MSALLFFACLIQAVLAARDSLRIAIQVMLALEIELDSKLNYLLALYNHMQDMETRMKDAVEVTAAVTMNMRGTLFVIETEVLSASSNIFFQTLIYSDPDPEYGYYFIDRPFEGFDRIISALKEEALSYEGLNDYETLCINDNLAYFRLSFPRFLRVFNKLDSWAISKDFYLSVLHSLLDGRLCSGTSSGVIMIWNTSTYTCEMELLGHTNRIRALTQLGDERLCSASNDFDMKIWNIYTGECLQTLTSLDNYVSKMIQYSSTQLLCSGSSSIEMWNLQTGTSLKLMYILGDVRSLDLLPNGNIVSLNAAGIIQIWSFELETCVRTILANAVVFAKLESGHLCTVTSKGLVSIWNHTTGTKIKSFQLHLKYIFFGMTVLKDRRVFIRAHDASNKNGCFYICNLDSEVCEPVIKVLSLYHAQLYDGRLCTAVTRTIKVWG